jgi:hypothetical protein
MLSASATSDAIERTRMNRQLSNVSRELDCNRLQVVTGLGPHVASSIMSRSYSVFWQDPFLDQHKTAIIVHLLRIRNNVAYDN